MATFDLVMGQILHKPGRINKRGELTLSLQFYVLKRWMSDGMIYGRYSYYFFQSDVLGGLDYAVKQLFCAHLCFVVECHKD